MSTTPKRRRFHALLATSAVAASAICASSMAMAPQAHAGGPTGPKNVIVLISDGGGYNHYDIANLYESGKTLNQVTVDPATGSVQNHAGEATRNFENWPVQVGQSHYAANGVAQYDADAAWASFSQVKAGATDSAAAGTALGTGVKVNNGTLGFAPDGKRLLTVGEQAKEVGKAVGLVTSVNFNHATPAGYIAHNASRNDYQGLATEMIDSGVDVLMGAGHPNFDDNGQPRATDNTWISGTDFSRVTQGQTDFSYVEEKADFEALAAGTNVPEKVFGLVQAANTLQYNRAGLNNKNVLPYTDAAVDSTPTLETMTEGALNVLEQDDDGFFLMVEGGAVDWAGHANQTTRAIEEQLDFNDSVDAVEAWVEANSSWDETLVIVTADHETGYLAGAGAGDATGWTPMTGNAGELPNVTWHSGSHTNALVPVFAKGAGSERLTARADQWDPVRGAYLDNTDLGEIVFDVLGHSFSEADEVVGLQAIIGDESAAPGTLSMAVDASTVTRLKGAGATKNGNLPNVSVTDTRSEIQAQGKGWTVSGTAADFTAGNRLLDADSLRWTPRVVGTESGASAATPATLGAPAVLADTDGETRVGTTTLGADLALNIPAEAKDGNYGSELTMTLFAKD